MTTAPIDLNMNLAQLMQDYPCIGQALMERGIDCPNCMAAQVDTLRDVARMYKLDLNALLKRAQELARTRQCT